MERLTEDAGRLNLERQAESWVELSTSHFLGIHYALGDPGLGLGAWDL